ncbi:hypothetical protein LXA43DRAFT_1056632 [Ganoderma leucocontextum]|nr:hypothetical protein LXA43DRAFT_1056632 [Ganoderma leucocontextum]
MALSLNSLITIYNRLFRPIDRITILVNSGTLTVLIQGLTLLGTGITEEEWELLLHFTLGYRAFYTEREDIPVSAYYEFIGLLVAETLTLWQPEPAGHALEAMIEWIHGNLPADIFDEPDINILPVMPYMHINDCEIAEMLVNALADLFSTSTNPMPFPTNFPH